MIGSIDDMPYPEAADRLAEEIAAGEFGGIRRIFIEEGVVPPEFVWDPAPEDLPDPKLQRLIEYWRSLAPEGGIASARAVDPLDIAFILGHVLLLDVLDGGNDFRYRVYGTSVAEYVGVDMTGRRTSEFEGFIPVFFIATYKAAIRRRAPIYMYYTTPLPLDLRAWHRLVMPLAGEGGGIVRFLTAMLPARWRYGRR